MSCSVMLGLTRIHLTLIRERSEERSARSSPVMTILRRRWRRWHEQKPSALILFSTICRMRVGGASMASLIGRRMRGCFSLRWIASRMTLSSLNAMRNCSIIAFVVASSVAKFFTNSQWSMQLSASTGVMKWHA